VHEFFVKYKEIIVAMTFVVALIQLVISIIKQQKGNSPYALTWHGLLLMI
jgi:hypothetical protein